VYLIVGTLLHASYSKTVLKSIKLIIYNDLKVIECNRIANPGLINSIKFTY